MVSVGNALNVRRWERTFIEDGGAFITLMNDLVQPFDGGIRLRLAARSPPSDARLGPATLVGVLRYLVTVRVGIQAAGANCSTPTILFPIPHRGWW